MHWRRCGRSLLLTAGWLWALAFTVPENVGTAENNHYKLSDSAPGAGVTPREQNPTVERLEDSEGRARRIVAAAQASSRDFAAQVALAKLLHFQGVEGNDEAAERATTMLIAFARDHPHDPMIRAYLGSARLLEARRTWALWRKGALGQEGLTLLDEAVRLAPEDFEVRFIRGVSTYHLPTLFGRAEQAAADIGWVAARAEEAVAAGHLDRTIATAALFYEGLIRATRSEMDAARTAWQAAVALGPATNAGKSAAVRLRESEPRLYTR